MVLQTQLEKSENQFDSTTIYSSSPTSSFVNDLNTSILDKMYNIHQQTYQVCKDALVLPKEVPNCPTMNAICSMLRQYGRKDSTPIERQAASSSSPSSPTM
ncbi:hypothetical protein SSS_10187 [Sarcoptes scabiei]|nr:hypothetical protein SSS_10187 [Sarcoptes scabiei]